MEVKTGGNHIECIRRRPLAHLLIRAGALRQFVATTATAFESAPKVRLSNSPAAQPWVRAPHQPKP
jgi:hypothetical protein